MPELPEVESIRIGLEKYLVGHIIGDVSITYPKIFRGQKELVTGASILGVRRFAKVLAIDLSNNYSILIHVKMTGQLLYSGPHLNKKPRTKNLEPIAGKHTHVVFQLDQDGILFFNDTRKFGWLEVLKTVDIQSFGFIRKLGPEPFAGLTLKLFKKVLAQSKAPIKMLLMNQEKIGGVGNIYANDALWLAKIHPKRQAYSLSGSERF